MLRQFIATTEVRRHCFRGHRQRVLAPDRRSFAFLAMVEVLFRLLTILGRDGWSRCRHRVAEWPRTLLNKSTTKHNGMVWNSTGIDAAR